MSDWEIIDKLFFHNASKKSVYFLNSCAVCLDWANINVLARLDFRQVRISSRVRSHRHHDRWRMKRMPESKTKPGCGYRKGVAGNSTTSMLMRARGMAVFPVGTEPRMMKIREMAEWDHLDIWWVVCSYLLSSVVTRKLIVSQLPEEVHYNKSSHWSSGSSTLKFDPHTIWIVNTVFPQQRKPLTLLASLKQLKAKLISCRRPCFIIRFGLPWQVANSGSRSRYSLKETGWNGWGVGTAYWIFSGKWLHPPLCNRRPCLSFCALAANWQEGAMSNSFLLDGFGNFAKKSNSRIAHCHNLLTQGWWMVARFMHGWVRY